VESEYVIVGAGSAGCVLANRLSADPSNTVTLLEAGGPDTNPWIHIPVGYFRTIHNPKVDWCYKTEPDPELNNRSIDWPRGKVLGGSSSLNGLLYVRGQPQDYDRWAQMGNPGWSWDDVLPLFKRSENNMRGEDEFHGADGPLSVSDIRIHRPITDAWVEAAQAAGYDYNPDYNGAVQEGAGFFQLTARNGRRCSAAVAFLKPARSRDNLRIITHAAVNKVILVGKRATGVTYTDKSGREQTVRANKEVILCGGAINSPQLLMLSGIGDADHLPTLFGQAKIGLKYIMTRTGPMAMAASLATGFFKTRPDLETPDIQFHVQPLSAENPGKGADKFSAFTMSVCQLRPESTGEIRLKSADPLSPDRHLQDGQ